MRIYFTVLLVVFTYTVAFAGDYNSTIFYDKVKALNDIADDDDGYYSRTYTIPPQLVHDFQLTSNEIKIEVTTDTPMFGSVQDWKITFIYNGKKTKGMGDGSTYNGVVKRDIKISNGYKINCQFRYNSCSSPFEIAATIVPQ